MKNLFRIVPVIIALLSFVAAAEAAVVSLTPSSMTSDYRGWVTVDVSGIPTGATAVVEAYIDFDDDGVVDSEDVRVMYYEVQDGVASPNADSIIVADSDGEQDGAIEAKLNFWTGRRAAGNYIFQASGNWGSASATGQLTPVPTSQSVSGTLLNSKGRSIEGIVVIWNDQDDQIWYSSTDSDGAFTIYLPKAGRYFVMGFHYGMLATVGTGMLPVDLQADQQMENVEVKLSKSSIYASGRIYDSSTGLGISNAFIMGEGEGQIPWISRTATDSNGIFSLPVLEGEAEIFIDEENISSRGYVGQLEVEDIEILSNGLSDLDFAIEKTGEFITGKVYWADTEIGEPGVGIYSERDESESLTYSVEGGRYAIGVLPGYCTVGIDDEEYPSSAVLPAPYREVLVNQGGTVTGKDFALEVVSATVNVQVLDSSQDPVYDVWVWMNDSQSNYLGGANTDVSGKATLGMTAGCYQIGLDGDDLYELGFSQVLNQQVCLATGEIRDITFTLSSGYEVTGTVTSASDGSPIGSAWIEAFDANASWTFKYGTNTLSDGTFTMNIPEGSYRFRANKDHFLSEFYDQQQDNWDHGTTVVVSSETAPVSGIDFTLESSARLHGTVLRSDTQSPVTTAQIYLYNEQGYVQRQDSVEVVDGTFLINIAPGNYKLKVEPHLPDMTGFAEAYYYDDSNSLQEADIILLTAGDTTEVTIWIRPSQQQITENPDVNRDGFVDGADLLILQKYWQQIWPQE